MKWIIDDLCRAIAALKRWQTWLGIGLLALFAGLAVLLSRYAFRTDAVLLFLHRTAGSCRQLTNGIIIFMFCGMIFFAFSAVLTLGECQRYLDLRQHHAQHAARQALRGAIAWGAVAVSIAIAALIFFNAYCR